MAAKKYRVLREIELDGKPYKPDTVLVVDETIGKTYEAAGALDANKAAVDYVEKTLESKAVTHEVAPTDSKAEGDGK